MPLLSGIFFASDAAAWAVNRKAAGMARLTLLLLDFVMTVMASGDLAFLRFPNKRFGQRSR